MFKPGQYVRYNPDRSTDEAQRLVYVVHSVDGVHGTVSMVCINPISSDNPTVTVSQDDIEKVWEGQ